MKFQCPHCNNKSVSAFGKFMSRTSSPARCDSCGKNSCEPFSSRVIYNLLSGLGFPLSVGIGLYFDLWWPIFGWLSFTILFPFCMLFYSPLIKLEAGVVKSAIKRQYIAWLMLIALIAWAAIRDQ